MTSQTPGLETASAISVPLAAQPVGAPSPRAGTAEERSPTHMGQPTATPLQKGCQDRRFLDLDSWVQKSLVFTRRKKASLESFWIAGPCLVMETPPLSSFYPVAGPPYNQNAALGYEASKSNIQTF